MKAEGLKYFTDVPLTVIGLVLFVVCFAGYIFWVNRKGSAQLYQQIANLPFTEIESAKELRHVEHQQQ